MTKQDKTEQAKTRSQGTIEMKGGFKSPEKRKKKKDLEKKVKNQARNSNEKVQLDFDGEGERKIEWQRVKGTKRKHKDNNNYA